MRYVGRLAVKFLLCESASKSAILEDAARWVQAKKKLSKTHPNSSVNDLLMLLFYKYPEFRNLFYHRIYHADDRPAHTGFLLRLCKILYRQMPSLYLDTKNVGPGLYINHGFCTKVVAAELGRNCWISQQVTIGVKSGGRPVICDGVRVLAGAHIFGNITVGENSIVGANAVVNRDVPPNVTVVGIPARIIKENGKRVDRELSLSN